MRAAVAVFLSLLLGADAKIHRTCVAGLNYLLIKLPSLPSASLEPTVLEYLWRLRYLEKVALGGCRELEWSVKMSKGDPGALDYLLQVEDWAELMMRPFPVFLVMQATQSQWRAAGEAGESQRAAEAFAVAELGEQLEALKGSISRVRARVRQEVFEVMPSMRHHEGTKWRGSLWDFIETAARQTVLPPLRSLMRWVGLWAASGSGWLQAGHRAGIWMLLHEMHASLHADPWCRGAVMQTSHTQYFHPLCVSQAMGEVAWTVVGAGFWGEADCVAHVFLFILRSLKLALPVRVVDVGANIGTVSVLLSRLGFEVDAVEADTENARILRENVWLEWKQGLTTAATGAGSRSAPGMVRVHEVAASDAAGQLPFGPVLGEDPASFSIVSRSPSSFVRGARLDEELPSGRGKLPPRLIKLDVEGYEWHALRGLQRALRFTRALFLEVVPELLERSGCHSPAALFQAAPNFTSVYSVEESLMSSPFQIEFLRLRPLCTELQSWEAWGSACARNRSNFLLSREPLPEGTSQELSLHDANVAVSMVVRNGLDHHAPSNQHKKRRQRLAG